MDQRNYIINPVIKELSQLTLCGNPLSMSLQNDRTAELWKNFMPMKKYIQRRIGNELFSVQVYPKDYFQQFDPGREFIKWAGVQVEYQTVPGNDLQILVIPSGLYAIFPYKGLSSDSAVFHYIFSEWLPSSGYILADRPHFEVLGEKYRNNDPLSEEDIYIPIILKANIVHL